MANLRAVVETALGIVANFAVSAGRFRGNVLLQGMCVILAYEFTQWKMMRNPVRPHYLPPSMRTHMDALSLNILDLSEEEISSSWTTMRSDAVRAGAVQLRDKVPGSSAPALIYSGSY